MQYIVKSLMHEVLSSNCFSARDTNEIKQLDTYSEYSPDELL